MFLDNSMDNDKLFKYIGIAAIGLLLVGLLGWALFIRKETASLESADSARGFSVGIPSFLGSKGSNAANTDPDTAKTTGGAPQGEGAPGEGKRSAFLTFLGFGEKNPERVVGEQNEKQDFEMVGEREKNKAPRLVRISAAPVAGAAFITGTSTRVRYVERATGYVFEAEALTGTSVRITNTLVPKVYEAHIGGDGLIIQRTVRDGLVETLAGKISTTTENGFAQLRSVNLGAQVSTVLIKPTSSSVLMTMSTPAGTEIVRTTWNGEAGKSIVTVPAGSFVLHAPADDRLILVERAASGLPGSAYRVTTALAPILRNLPGLTVLPHANGSLLYGIDTGTSLRMFIQTSSSTPSSLPIATTAEKCVWAQGGGQTAYCAVPQSDPGPQFLDRWYRGLTHTADSWYTVKAGAASADVLFAIDSSSAIDVERPVIDSTNSYLAFINARDKSLWILRIAE